MNDGVLYSSRAGRIVDQNSEKRKHMNHCALNIKQAWAQSFKTFSEKRKHLKLAAENCCVLYAS